MWPKLMGVCRRNIKLAAGLAAIGLVLFGLFIQERHGLEPCPLCITQRVIFLVSGVGFLFLHFRPLPRIVEALALGGVNMTGAVFSLRHSLIQRGLVEAPSECGVGLDYMFDTFPLHEALALLFRGTGDCAAVDWRFLGLTIPEWALLWFVIFIAAAVVNFKTAPRKEGQRGH